jgi:hypothetical protein
MAGRLAVLARCSSQVRALSTTWAKSCSYAPELMYRSTLC